MTLLESANRVNFADQEMKVIGLSEQRENSLQRVVYQLFFVQFFVFQKCEYDVV